MKKTTAIFYHSECLSEEMLTKYVSGKLSSAEKHRVEKHLVDCEMCSDAVEGLAMIGDEHKISRITSELNQRIQNRVEEKKEGKIIFLQQYRTQLAVAASVVVLLGFVWFFRSSMSMKELSPETSEKIFAEKFEPYPAAAEDANAEAVQAPAVAQEESKVNVQRANRVANSGSGEEGKEISVATQLSKEGGKNEQIFYQTAPEKQVAAPSTSMPQGDVVNRDEIILSDKTESNLQQSTPQKPAFSNITSTSTASGAAAVSKNDQEADNRNLSEKKKVQEVELLALETKSQSEKYRAKDRKEGKTAVKKLAEAQPATPKAEIAVAEDVVMVEENVQMKMLDSVSATILTDDDSDKAMQKYEQKDYSGAAVDFEAALKKDPNNYNALFYSAVSYLGTGETDKAIANLNKVLEKKDGEFFDAAQWYLSLAYIKKNDTQNARKNLAELKRNSKSKYQKQAEQTLNEMRK